MGYTPRWRIFSSFIFLFLFFSLSFFFSFFVGCLPLMCESSCGHEISRKKSRFVSARLFFLFLFEFFVFEESGMSLTFDCIVSVLFVETAAGFGDCFHFSLSLSFGVLFIITMAFIYTHITHFMTKFCHAEPTYFHIFTWPPQFFYIKIIIYSCSVHSRHLSPIDIYFSLFFVGLILFSSFRSLE